MDQEKMKILSMVEEKKITAAEAARLLDALDGCGPSESSAPRNAPAPGRLLKIRVSEIDTGRARVNLCVPVGIAHVIRSLLPAQEMKRMEEQGIKVNAIMDAISEDVTGRIFDVEDPQHRVHVEVSIE